MTSPAPVPAPDVLRDVGSARAAERGVLIFAAAALVLKVGLEAGLPAVLLRVTLLLAAVCAALGFAFGRKRGGYFDGWRLLIALLALASVPQVHTRVGGDGFEYYALARSLVFDQDLRFENEFEGLGAKPVFSAHGEVTSRFPIGLALLWVPPLLFCRIVALALHALGVAIDTSGFGTLYQSAATTTSFALAMLGLFLLERLLRKLFGETLSALTVCGVWLATPLHFYAVANPSMSHGASAFAATLFLASWLEARADVAGARWLGVGLAGGLMSLIRIQDGVLLAMPALDLVLRRRGWRPLLVLALGPAMAAGLQLGIWAGMYGSGFLTLAAEQGHFGRPELNFWGVLFSARHGLLTWTPIYLPALLGIVVWLFRDARLAISMMLGFGLSVALNSLQWDWWGADAFGQRRLLGLTPILALGLAEALSFLRRRPLLPLAAAVAVLIVWNQQFAYIYNSEMVAGKGQAVSLDRLAAAQVDVAARRVLRLADVLPRPVFVLLYDNLRGVWLDEGPRSLGGLLDLGDAEPDAFPFVGHGWSEPVRQGALSWRFSNVRRSWLRVPLMTPSDFDVTLRIRAAFESAPVSVSLLAGGESVGVAALRTEWHEVTFLLPARILAPGINDLSLSYSTTPADIDPDFRGRNAAVAVDWIQFRRRLVAPSQGGPRR